jgi:2-polyprenyl-3-methyl-5-hydroxy-6-metoxy-1,4-benzoquinol methylase
MTHLNSEEGNRSRFSKSSSDIQFRTDSYLQANHEQNLSRQKLNALYANQPLRISCKVCKNNFLDSPWFENFGIRYYQCLTCGHLNGQYQDTLEFSGELYTSEEKSSYDSNYDSEFDIRVENIYFPKLQFLLDNLDLEIEEIRILDFGCGAGHFVKAAQLSGVESIGLETNSKLVKIGQQYVGKKSIFRSLSTDDFINALENFKPNVVSFIGVLEHLNDMDVVLDICKANGVKFLYSSVPVFSLSSVLQTLSDRVFPRQLSGGHTHLFTMNSLKLLLNSHNYQIHSDWWFGTDFSDLRRTLSIVMAEHSHNLDSILDTVLSPFLDDLQSILDQGKITSEVHTISELMP